MYTMYYHVYKGKYHILYMMILPVYCSYSSPVNRWCLSGKHSQGSKKQTGILLFEEEDFDI